MVLVSAGIIGSVTAAIFASPVVASGTVIAVAALPIIGKVIKFMGSSATAMGKSSETLQKVADPASALVTAGMYASIAKSESDIKLIEMDINITHNIASMYAQDLSRLYQLQGALFGMIQSLMHDRRERLNSIRM
jgi:hypothetical protein